MTWDASATLTKTKLDEARKKNQQPGILSALGIERAQPKKESQSKKWRVGDV